MSPWSPPKDKSSPTGKYGLPRTHQWLQQVSPCDWRPKLGRTRVATTRGRLMKRLGLALPIAVGGWGEAAAGGFVDGNSLLESCTRNDSSSWSDCLGHITGVADVVVGDPIDGVKACYSDRVTRGQTRDVVIQWLQHHPQDRHF